MVTIFKYEEGDKNVIDKRSDDKVFCALNFQFAEEGKALDPEDYRQIVDIATNLKKIVSKYNKGTK